MLFGASVTAVLVKYTFPYGWSWVECLLLGSIFSATDPVAVVAVLKEVQSLMSVCLFWPPSSLFISLLTFVTH